MEIPIISNTTPLSQDTTNPTSSVESDVLIAPSQEQITPTKESTSSKEEEKEHKPKEIEKKSVRDYGVCFDQNWKFRRRMEDAHYIEDRFNGIQSQGFFAVYDGHGGKEAAIFASENLHKMLAENLSKENFTNPEEIQKIFVKTYQECDEKLKNSSVPNHHGCTSITCLITGTGTLNRQLWCANAGDAGAVLCRGGKAIRLSEEHKVSSELEAKRISESGGFIINGRVNGQIMITRSLGDHLMKDFIIPTPYTSHHNLTEEDTHLIVACDGLWDVCSDQQACDFILENSDSTAPDLAKKLLIKALQDGSTDNLSIIIVKL